VCLGEAEGNYERAIFFIAQELDRFLSAATAQLPIVQVSSLRVKSEKGIEKPTCVSLLPALYWTTGLPEDETLGVWTVRVSVPDLTTSINNQHTT
jgi:hypothetical protein